MSHASQASLLALLIVAGTASATTVGGIKGKAVPGLPLEVNIPFAVDDPGQRACASANVRYGNVPARKVIVDVQGQGLKRNLLVTSKSAVGEQPVTVNVRVGCGPRAVTRSFVMPSGASLAKAPPVIVPSTRPVALMRNAEPLFPPALAEARAAENATPKTDGWMTEELRKARADAATAFAQLDATRKELAAVLDMGRRTSQTLIKADHQVRAARSEAAQMRLVLIWVAIGLVVSAAGLAWFEFQRVLLRRRDFMARAPQEPTAVSGGELPA